MTRLTVFLSVILGFVLILSLHYFRNLPVNNQKFDFEKQKAAFHSHEELVAELTHPKVHEETEEEVKAIEVKIDLNSRELINGSKIYSKCVSCHGKNGEGKASQKAPHIGGQFDWYVVKQVNDMKSGARINDVMMPTIKGLTEQDIKDVALYVSKLPWKMADYEASLKAAAEKK